MNLEHAIYETISKCEISINVDKLKKLINQLYDQIETYSGLSNDIFYLSGSDVALNLLNLEVNDDES